MDILNQNTYTLLAQVSFDTNNNLFYRQSDVTEVTELTWYLSCFSPYNRLKLAYSFKDKSDRLVEVNTGIFTYPILMQADILLYDRNSSSWKGSNTTFRNN